MTHLAPTLTPPAFRTLKLSSTVLTVLCLAVGVKIPLSAQSVTESVCAEQMHGEQLLGHRYLDKNAPADEMTAYLDDQAPANSPGILMSAVQPVSLQSSGSGASWTHVHQTSMAVDVTLPGNKQLHGIDTSSFVSKVEVKMPKMVPVERQAEYISAFGSQTKLPRTPLLPGY